MTADQSTIRKSEVVNELVRLLKEERFGVADAVAICRASKPLIEGWLRHGLVWTDNPLRFSRHSLTISDLVRIRAIAVLTALGVEAEDSAPLANELFSGDIARLALDSPLWAVFRGRDDLLIYLPLYLQGEWDLSFRREACILLSPAFVVQEVIRRAVDHLETEDKRATTPAD